jgi:LmbE family N-acetylglucosaminyl deacetylase
VLTLSLSAGKPEPKQILCLGAHCDDIEIGCSGTVLTLLQRLPDVHVTWVVMASNERRAQEALESAHTVLASIPKKTVVIKSFRDGFLPYGGAELKEYFEELKHDVAPDLVLTHHGQDFHQDHRLVSELTWNTFRNHLILEYEIPKYDGDFGNPNLFVALDAETCVRKVQNILSSFRSQADKPWFTQETFWALLRLRGMQANSATGYAEAFFCRKALVA